MDLKGFGLSDDDLRQLGYEVGGDDGGRGETTRDQPSRPGRSRRSTAQRVWVATVAFLCLVTWGSSLRRGLPPALPATSSDTLFSAERALAQLAEISREPRPTGSAEHGRIQTYLVGRLRVLGLEPEVQATTSFTKDAALVRSATVRNVIARVPGLASTGTVVLRAHYDGAPLSPAASDDAVGLATVLEAVRALVAGGPLPNDVIVLLTDGDELDLLGSRAFADRHSWMQDVSLVLTVESYGVAGPAILFETGAGNGRIVETVAAAAPQVGTSSLGRVVRQHVLESADGDPLLRGDRRGLSLSAVQGAAFRHQPGDTRDRVNAPTLQHGGDQLLALARSFGRHDLRADLEGPDRVYFSLPGIGLVHYSTTWVWVLSLTSILLWALLGQVLRRRRGSVRGLLVGLGAGVSLVGLSVAAGRALFDFSVDRHPEYGALTTAFYDDGLLFLAVAALSLACGTVAYAIGRRWARADELIVGALTVPLAFCAWLTVAFPFAAPVAQWPLVAALSAGAFLTVLGPNRATGLWAWAGILPLSAVVLLFAVPSLELVSEAWTFRQAVWLGGLLGLSVLLLFPLMGWLSRPRSWWTPLLAAGLASALVILSLPTVRGAASHPVPTTLVYLADEPVNRGPLLLPGATDSIMSRARFMSGSWLTVPGPGEQWARSWVGDPSTGLRDAGVLLLGVDSLYEVAGTGPNSELSPPRVQLRESLVESGRRHVRLGIEPGLRGEMLGVHLPDGTAGALTGVGGATWDAGSTSVRSLMHWGRPETNELPIDLELAPQTTEIELLVVEHHLRPREVLGTDFFERADSMVPNVSLNSDRVIQRTSVRLSVADTNPSPGQ